MSSVNARDDIRDRAEKYHWQYDEPRPHVDVFTKGRGYIEVEYVRGTIRRVLWTQGLDDHEMPYGEKDKCQKVLTLLKVIRA